MFSQWWVKNWSRTVNCKQRTEKFVVAVVREMVVKV